MIPTRRRNPWRIPTVVLLISWVALVAISIFTDLAWSRPLAIAAIVLFVITSNLYRFFEDESAREVMVAVYGRTWSEVWTSGYDAGIVAERLRNRR